MECVYKKPTAWRNNLLIGGAVMVPLTAIAFQVGTGGEPTPDYLKMRGQKGYAYFRYVDNSKRRKPSENLSYIRENLKQSVTELAGWLAVSRQAIYDWQSGKAITDDNAAKLERMAIAVNMLVSAGISPTEKLFQRKIANGQALSDIILVGGSIEHATASLVEILRLEDEQRKKMQQRFVNRKKLPADISDYGIPMLSEES